MTDEIRGLAAIVSDQALGGVMWTPEDLPYFQEPTPFWTATTQSAGGPLTADVLAQAFEAMDRQLNAPPEPCVHMELYPGWARKQRAKGLSEIPCPWCGDAVSLPPLGPRRPPVADA